MKFSEIYQEHKNTEINKLNEELRRIKGLLSRLSKQVDLDKKNAILNNLPEIKDFLSKPSYILSYFNDLSEKNKYIVKSVFAIKQGKTLFTIPKTISDPTPHYHRLVEDLLEIDHFYKDLGGIIGYQYLVLSLLIRSKKQDSKATFLPPKGIDLSKKNHPSVKRAILNGILYQKETAEIYPVGGAAERLQLKDEATGKNLPAACLIFKGKHLLENAIHDLQAREYLYYKLFGEQIVTPLALMTSKVNHNNDYIQEICKKNRWFGRLEKNFKFFIQPSIPVFNKKGDWCLEKPLKLLLRPGGHGVIWKLAIEMKVFDWLESLGCKKALVRQINNPMAAVDYGLTGFLGIGHSNKKRFGFASCERRVNAKEGINVLQIIEDSKGKQATITNIEYCDFKKFGIEDKPKKSGSLFSFFPSNTNILFIDIKAIRKAILKISFPGLIINFREGKHYIHNKGMKKERIARVETTMQNIADVFQVPFGEEMPTYVTFNERCKTISTAKQKINQKGLSIETPESCFYDFMKNAQDLLKKHCNIKFIFADKNKDYKDKTINCLMSYHPALGPFYSIIKQKIYGGEIHYGSELQLEIADLEMKNFFLKGSLLIFADSVMGHTDKTGRLMYSHKTGQCVLKDVRIENRGINWRKKKDLFWKNDIKRHESLTINLKGNSIFEAKNVTFKGNQVIEVPNGSHMIVTQKENKLCFNISPLDNNKPFWTYQIDNEDSIILSK